MQLIENREDGGRELYRIVCQEMSAIPQTLTLSVGWDALSAESQEAYSRMWERLVLPYRAMIAGLETGNKFLLQAWKTAREEK